MRSSLEILRQLEADLREARTDRVLARIKEVQPTKLPREAILPFANICRRSGKIVSALKALTPLIHPAKGRRKSAAPATPAERAEFAVCLQRYGAVREAKELLEQSDSAHAPEALLYRAFCHFNLWEYADAIPLLESYLALDLAPYARLVGRINLSAAHVATSDFSTALARLSEDVAIAGTAGFWRLQGNAFELRAQTKILTKDFSGAEEDLSAAEALLRKEGGFESAFVTKWRAIRAALESGDLSPLENYRQQAGQTRDWENLRDADRFLLLARFEGERFNRLIFGSPNPKFRERLCRDLGRELPREPWLVGEAKAPVLDVREGTFLGNELLTPGQMPHRLLIAVSRDLYRPISMGALFSDLYPGESFNVFTSPTRVHRLIERAQEYLRDGKVPAAIVCERGSYSLRLSPHVALRTHLSTELSTKNDLLLRDLAMKLDRHLTFTSKEAGQVLGLHERSLQRFLQWGIESARVERLGSGPATRYAIAS